MSGDQFEISRIASDSFKAGLESAAKKFDGIDHDYDPLFTGEEVAKIIRQLKDQP